MVEGGNDVTWAEAPAATRLRAQEATHGSPSPPVSSFSITFTPASLLSSPTIEVVTLSFLPKAVKNFKVPLF